MAENSADMVDRVRRGIKPRETCLKIPDWEKYELNQPTSLKTTTLNECEFKFKAIKEIL